MILYFAIFNSEHLAWSPDSAKAEGSSIVDEPGEG